MAGRRRLKLSTLKTDLAYPVDNNVSQKRCLIHVKLTDFCVRTVENLIDSEKGAFFTLRFDENGGKMTIPVDQGDPRVFHFKTAPLKEGEGQGSLECVHQELPHSQDHLLSCWGVMEHRITVQGTDEVYARTKQQMERAEKLRKEQRAQEIEVPQSHNKLKPFQTAERVSPVPSAFRKPNRPKVPPSKSTAINKSTASFSAKPHYPPPKSSVSAHPSADSKASSKQSSRSTYSLKDRVIHMLALKPHSRDHIVTKLKKATKRSETSMPNLDSILEEVSETVQDTYRLKPHYLKTLQVEDSPLYTEAQKQMLKRTKNQGVEESSSEARSAMTLAQPSKRSITEQQCPPVSPKKPKLEQFEAESSVPIRAPAVMPQTSGSVQFTDANSGSLHPTHLTAQDEMSEQKKDTRVGQTVADTFSKHGAMKIKPKKIKKKKRDDSEVVTSNPTSTSYTPDHISQFPPLTSDEERQQYKQVFNKEYVEYLQLKESIDQVSNQSQKECSALSERLNSVPKHSEEYKEVKKLIQEKYRELHRNRTYVQNKLKFDELHQKLDHIKQMVLQYDAKK